MLTSQAIHAIIAVPILGVVLGAWTFILCKVADATKEQA